MERWTGDAWDHVVVGVDATVKHDAASCKHQAKEKTMIRFPAAGADANVAQVKQAERNRTPDWKKQPILSFCGS